MEIVAKKIIDNFEKEIRSISEFYENYYLSKDIRLISEILSSINRNLILLGSDRILKSKQIKHIYLCNDELFSILIECDSPSAFDTMDSYLFVIDRYIGIAESYEFYELSHNLYEYKELLLEPVKK